MIKTSIQRQKPRMNSLPQAACFLTQVTSGRSARVNGYSSQMPPSRETQLRAYGLTPGARVQVLQQSPVTILALENLELALEHRAAAEVWVDEII